MGKDNHVHSWVATGSQELPDGRRVVFYTYVREKIEGICQTFDKGNADGTIHRCPMVLVPIS